MKNQWVPPKCKFLYLELSTAQQNKVSITVDRHSGNLLAGIHKSVLDTG